VLAAIYDARHRLWREYQQQRAGEVAGAEAEATERMDG